VKQIKKYISFYQNNLEICVHKPYLSEVQQRMKFQNGSYFRFSILHNCICEDTT